MFVFLVGCIVGILVSFFYLSYVSIVACTLLMVCMFFFMREKIPQRFVILCVIFFIGVVCGQIRMMFVGVPTDSTFDSLVSQPIVLVGKIVSEPVVSSGVQKLDVHATKVMYNNSTTDVDIGVRVSTESYMPYTYGDMVIATGTLKIPERIVGNDGREFDYAMYLYKEGIGYTLSYAKVEKIGETGSYIFNILYGTKRLLVNSIRDVFSQSRAQLLSGILLGTSGISKQIENDFRLSGLSHIVVLSGYNITVVAESVRTIVSFVGLPFGYLWSIVSVILFVLMSGASSSALRAGIMAVIALFGKEQGKTYNASRALLVAVVGMIIWNPFILLYDPSFHLSVIATCGVLFLTPIVYKLCTRIPERFGLRELSATTIGAQIAVLPYLIYMTGVVPLLSFVANMLVLPFIPATMLGGFLASVVGIVSPLLGTIVGLPTSLLLSYELYVAKIFASLSNTIIHIPAVPVFVLVVTYMCYIGLYMWYIQNHSPQKEVSDESIVSY